MASGKTAVVQTSSEPSATRATSRQRGSQRVAVRGGGADAAGAVDGAVVRVAGAVVVGKAADSLAFAGRAKADTAMSATVRAKKRWRMARRSATCRAHPGHLRPRVV